MARWVLSECGVKPLPRIYPLPSRNGFASKTFMVSEIRQPLLASKAHVLRSSLGLSTKGKSWALNVSTPVAVASVDEDNERERVNEVNGVEDEGSFDPAAPPPFRLADIRAAIPKHCWVRDPWRSMSYVVRDVVVVFGLAAVAAYFNNWVVWPLYWFAQGTMFWALFVLGHDW